MNWCEDCGREFERRRGRGGIARLCGECHLARRVAGIRKRSPWTPERDAYLRDHYDPRKKNAAAVAKALGVTVTAVHLRASIKGLSIKTKNRRPWTVEEIAFLEANAGERSTEWLARRMGRSVTSIRSKAADLGMFLAVRPDGFSGPDLAEGLGVSLETVHQWILSGRLRADRGTKGHYVVALENVREFLRANPYAFSVKRVDPTFFIEVTLGIATDRREVAADRRTA